MTTTYATLRVPAHDLKILREALCTAQRAFAPAGVGWVGRAELMQRLIDEIDRHRPLDADGKHGESHTDTCGCEDVQQRGIQVGEPTMDEIHAFVPEAPVGTTGWRTSSETVHEAFPEVAVTRGGIRFTNLLDTLTREQLLERLSRVERRGIKLEAKIRRLKQVRRRLRQIIEEQR